MIYKDYLQIYIARTDALDKETVYERVYETLPAFRKARIDSYRNGEVKKQSLAVFALLMRGLKDIGIDPDDPAMWEEMRFCSEVNGKPYFAGREDIHFSMSHTRGAAICAVSGSRVGCDIEHIKHRSSLYSIAKRSYTPRELAYCLRTPREDDMPEEYAGVYIDPRAFYHIWTRKEAYAKYTGEGLKEILSQLDTEEFRDHIYSMNYEEYVWAIYSDACASSEALMSSKILINPPF